MLIVDSQVHLWAADTPDRPWPPGRAARAQKPYAVTKEALLLQMDLAGVSRIVIVPPSWEGVRNELALEAARRARPHRRAAPRAQVTIDHVGLRRITKGPGVFEDLPKVCALAKHPNVAVKASGVPSLSAESYPFRDVHEPMRRLFDAYGPQRMFWGTDLTRMPCSYRECIDLFTKEMPWLQGDDLDSVMGRGVCAWLGWPLPT